MKYYSGEAIEIISNKSICVKEGHKIRNIRDEDDINSELLVFVSNIVPHGDEIYDIKQFEAVRYAVLNASFR